MVAQLSADARPELGSGRCTPWLRCTRLGRFGRSVLDSRAQLSRVPGAFDPLHIAPKTRKFSEIAALDSSCRAPG